MDVQTAAGQNIAHREQVIADREGQRPQEDEGGDEGDPHPQRRLPPVINVLLVGNDDLLSKVEAPEDVQAPDVHVLRRWRRQCNSGIGYSRQWRTWFESSQQTTRCAPCF